MAKAVPLLLAGGGVVMLWSGIKGYSISEVLRNVVSGKSPTSGIGQSSPIGGLSMADPTGGAVVSSGGISYSGSSQLQQLWTSNGGPANTAAFAAKVAMAESGGNAKSTSGNPDGGTNVGIWQLDTKGVGAGYTVAQLQDPNTNAKITIAATKGGTDWSEWGDPVTAAVGYHYTPGSAT